MAEQQQPMEQGQEGPGGLQQQGPQGAPGAGIIQPPQQVQAEQVGGEGGNQRADNPLPRGTDAQMRDGKHSVRSCPKYDRKVPWRQFVYEFKSWVETFDIEQCGDEFIKNTLVWAMKGQAQDMISCHRRGTETFRKNVTWLSYARAIESIFAPPAESQLAKQEFKAYRQRQTEDISSYLSTKRALHDVAYPNKNGNFDNLLDAVIEGIYNKEVKLQLLRSNPKDIDEMESNAVRIVANERNAFEQGFSRCETKDGLYHTTMIGVRHAQEEPMDISVLKDEIRTLKESINAVHGKPVDKSKISCYFCGKKGHWKSECRSLAAQRGGVRGRGGFSARNQNQRGGSSGGKFPFDCHHCGKNGHKKADCYKWKQEQQGSGGQRGRGGQFGSRKVREMDNQDQQEDGPSGYSRFLEPVGETEQN